MIWWAVTERCCPLQGAHLQRTLIAAVKPLYYIYNIYVIIIVIYKNQTHAIDTSFALMYFSKMLEWRMRNVMNTEPDVWLRVNYDQYTDWGSIRLQRVAADRRGVTRTRYRCSQSSGSKRKKSPVEMYFLCTNTMYVQRVLWVQSKLYSGI